MVLPCVVSVAGGLARVMALPPVERLLDRFGLGIVDEETKAAP
ncbi:hypothetical protein [Streptomyces cacaoi]|nr:hypothetical protein [Streptomyces cacaoi]